MGASFYDLMGAFMAHCSGDRGMDSTPQERKRHQQHEEERSRSQYGEREWWERRYRMTKADFFDWYCTFAALKQLVLPPGPVSEVLVVGCGNSRMPLDMARDAYAAHVTAIDFSEACIEGMKRLCGSDVVDFVVCDAADMSHIVETSTVDVIIEKGTLDAVVCQPGGQNVYKNIVEEMARVLKHDTGVAIVVSYNSRYNFKPYFAHHDIARVPLSGEALLIREMRRFNGDKRLAVAALLAMRLHDGNDDDNDDPETSRWCYAHILSNTP